jgi:hypothetical protein
MEFLDGFCSPIFGVVAHSNKVLRLNYPSEKWEHLEDWSSGGPTAEGRIKPDVVAPGGYIKSAARVTNEQFSPGEVAKKRTCRAHPWPVHSQLVAWR